MIFDVQRGSFADGPGIRTVFFFKGCALRCRWCHNPESQSGEKELLFYAEKCRHCGMCETVCPHHLQACSLCGACAETCPHDARSLCGREESAQALYELAEKDRAFYDASGGGVTCSGGECMLQVDFLSELLHRCHAAGIHTAVDTAGDVPWQSFETVLPDTDLFLYDIKCLDERRHVEGTGVSNRRILENLRRLSERADVLIRVPVIPGFNDGELPAIAAFVRTIRSVGTELLPYHALGEHKYAALGRSCEAFPVPSAEETARYRALLA